MKFGLVVNKKTENIGDDIQSYAAMRLLPSVDYVINRENMDTFESNGERVKAIMNGWYMYNKSNWPPAANIIPLWVSMHITENDYFGIGEQFLTGIGGAYLKHYAPIGARDGSTLKMLERNHIQAYLSGCLTLTIPRFDGVEKSDEVLLVDLDEKSERLIRETYPSENYQLLTHHVDAKEYCKRSMEDRLRGVEHLLRRYQGAKCVITSRLHCALPCLALKTPVLLVYKEEYASRMQSFLKLLHYAEIEKLDAGLSEFDISRPQDNRTEYLAIRENLTGICKKFVEGSENIQPFEVPLKDRYVWQKALLDAAEFTFRQDLDAQERWIRELVDAKQHLERQVAEKEVCITEMEKRVRDLDDSKTNFEEQLTQKEQYLTELKKWTEQLEDCTSDLEQRVQNKDLQIAKLEKWCQVITGDRSYLEQQVQNRDLRIAELEKWCQEVTEGKAYVEEQWKASDAAWKKREGDLERLSQKLALLLDDKKIQKIIKKRGFEL